MAFVAYGGLSTPNQVIEKMAEYILSRGYTINQTLTDDLNIYDMTYTDGKKFAFEDRTGQYHIVLRSANGTQIFGTTDTTAMDSTSPIGNQNINYTGIGMVVGEGYSSVQRWYNQYRVPVAFRGVQVYGAFMPMKVEHVWQAGGNYHTGDVVKYGGRYYECNKPHISSSSFGVGIAGTTNNFKELNSSIPEDAAKIAANQPFTYTLYCNNVTTPTDTLVFSLMKEDDDYKQVTHLVFGNIDKFDTWDGGAIFSGSSTNRIMGSDVMVYAHNKVSDRNILPVLSSGSISNTFLRINIDEAPTEDRGNIFWASSGTDNVTGKRLAMPIRLPLSYDVAEWGSRTTYGAGSIVFYDGDYYKAISANTGNQPYDHPEKWQLVSHSLSPGGNAKIPHYFYLQSRSRRDWGRNVNTLNCITIDMPIFASVLVDPDVLGNYASVGNVSGVFCISTLNMQTGHVYERNYPTSGDLDQVFPHGKRRGFYGYDGISIKQKED